MPAPVLDETSQNEIEVISRTTQIIVSALCAGIVFFAIFLLFFYEVKKGPAGIITYLSLGFAGLETIMCLIVPRVMVVAHRAQVAAGLWSAPGPSKIATDAGKVAQIYQVTTIVGCALLEGAAFFALIAYMLEGNIVAMAVAGLMLIGVTMHFPMTDKVRVWVENQLRIVHEELRD